MTVSTELDADLLERCREFAAVALRDAGERVLPHFRGAVPVDNKGTGLGAAYDPVTEADREAETLLRARIEQHFPFSGVLGEEHGRSGELDGPHWVIDPIDGTRSFVAGLLHWGMLLALNDGTRPVLGALYQPYTRELFIGTRAAAVLETPGATRPLATRAVRELDDAVVCATHPEMFADDADRDAFGALAERCRLSRLGTDCYAYGLLALGYVDLVVEGGLAPWDIQAQIPFIEAAGGVVTAWDGGDAQHGGRVVAAATPQLHERALAVLAGAATGEAR